MIKSDLNTIKKWSENLVKNLPPKGSIISDNLYLQNNAIQIAIISLLEYALKEKNLLKKQNDIKKIINKSSLEQLEKDHLIYLFLVRHTLIHNGGYCDKEFLKNCEKNLKKLKIEDFKEGLLSSIHPEKLISYINLVDKLIKEL